MVDLADAFMNNEVPRDAKLSGYAYVAVVMKGETKLGKIVVASKRNCGHVNRICEICRDEWAQDYTLGYDRTAAGRRLKP